MKKCKMCIVDDDRIHQFTVSKTIKYNNLATEVIVFSDGKEVYDFLVEHKDDGQMLPDIILLDINMPVMDGFQFLECYKQIKDKFLKKITIYMVTSSLDPVDINKARQIDDITDYLTKPVRTSQLADIIEKWQPAIVV